MSSPSKRKLHLRDSTRLAKSRGKKLPPNSQDKPLDLSSTKVPRTSTSSDSEDVPLSERFQFLRRTEASTSGVATPSKSVSPRSSSFPRPASTVRNEATLSEEETRFVASSAELLLSVKDLVDLPVRDEATGNDFVPPVDHQGVATSTDEGVGGAATPLGVSNAGVPTPSQGTFSFPSVTGADSSPLVPPDVSVPRRRKKALARKRTSAPAEVFFPGVATPPATSSGDPVPIVATPPSVATPSGERKSTKRPRASDSSSHFAAFSSTFLTKEARDRLSTIEQRTFLSERPIDLEAFSLKTDLIQKFTDLQLIGSVSPFSGFIPSVIHEFYCNLESAVFDPASPRFARVFVRGKYRIFSATAINQALGLTLSDFPDLPSDLDQIVHTITAGVRSRWPLKKDIPSSDLAGQFSLLHKIALFNWMPSSHSSGIKKSLAKLLYCIGTGIRVNLGQLIFDQLKPFASLKVNSSSLIFPNLIFKVLCASDKAFAHEKGKVVNEAVLRPSSKLLKKLSGQSFSSFASGPGSTSASIPEMPEEVSAPGVVTPMDAASLRTLHLTIRRLEHLEPLLLQFRTWVDEVSRYVHGSLGDLNALAAAHAPPPPPEL